jgi:hypothetical protein
MTSMLYHAGNRSFQDEFDGRRVAALGNDKAVTRRVQRRKTFIEGCIYFFYCGRRRIWTSDPPGQRNAVPLRRPSHPV